VALLDAVFYSEFLRFKVLGVLRVFGVLGVYTVRKRRFWPKHISGEAIKAHFKDKDIGHAYSLHHILVWCSFVCVCCEKWHDSSKDWPSRQGKISRQLKKRPPRHKERVQIHHTLQQTSPLLSLYWLQQQLRETFHGATTKIEEKTRPHSSFSVDVGGFLQ
jgi:hypothetical protein